MTYSKEKMEKNDNNSQSVKPDREMYRICPSKLSKRELEDLYFTLLENNLELKKTINGQQDKIRVMATKVQRMANTQDKLMSKELKGCCSGTKAIVDEQKDFITELKQTNQRIAERNQQLNRRLSSAKQFLKTTPPAAASRWPRTVGGAAATTPKKHNCFSQGQEIEPVRKTSASSQWEGSPKKSTKSQITVPLENKYQETETTRTFSNASQWEDRSPKKCTQTQNLGPVEKKSSKSDPCVENKCRSLMEELKVKIVTLQEELFNVHDEYSSRIGRLEDEVSEVRHENIRVVAQRSASEHELQKNAKRTNDILTQYRLYEAKCSELNTELSIEKRKVAELETQLKAANMSGQVNKALDEHLTGLNSSTPRPPPRRLIYSEAPTKYNPSKSSSSASKASKASPNELMSEDDNCESCGCKQQLSNDPPRSSTPSEDLNSIKCDVCECPKYGRKLLANKQKEVQCRCPTWMASLSQPPLSEAQGAKCMNCCYKDELEATDSPPSKIVKRLAPEAALSGSPTEKDGSKRYNEGDDSGYQETDELYSMGDILKQNKELKSKILKLQSQLDHIKKDERYEMFEVEPNNLSESNGSPTKTTDKSTAPVMSPPLLEEITKKREPPGALQARRTSLDIAMSAPIQSPPLIGELPQARNVLKHTENIKYMEDKKNNPTKPLQFTTQESDEVINEPGKLLNIQTLDNPEENGTRREWSERRRQSEDTRAKTKEDAYGTIEITDERSLDGSLDSSNDPEQKSDPFKLKIVEKKKENTGSVSQKSTIGFNPEKLKYLEAEGITANPEIKELREESRSLTESVPSNPELGFAIPRLASKASANKLKAEATPSSQNPQQAQDGNSEVLPGRLRLPMTEELVANNQAAARQPDETKKKKKEDCEYCAACSFDKECELKHTNNTVNHSLEKLALGMQKEQAKNHDEHNSSQKPDDEKGKKRNILSHFKTVKPNKQNKGKQTKEDLIATDGPISIPDVPLIDKIEQSLTNDEMFGRHSFEMGKDKKSMKQKKDISAKGHMIVNPTKAYVQKTCATIDEPISVPDVPLIDKDSSMYDKDDYNLIHPQLEVKMGTNQTESPHDRATQVERKANVTLNTDHKLLEKSRHATAHIVPEPAGLSSGEMPLHSDTYRRARNVSLYRRRSGTLSSRAVPARSEPPACHCVGQQDGYCSDKARNKSNQVQDSDKIMPLKDQRVDLSVPDRQTYTISSKQTSTSPDNTDCEMSYLSDLPMEKEKKSPYKARSLSPGEDRTATYTSTYSAHSPPTNYSLSEGEMPAKTSRRRNSNKFEGDGLYLNPTAHHMEAPPSQQMEEALQAITKEIRRCKNLLHAHRPVEHAWRASCSAPAAALPLRAAPATQGIGNTYAPTSIFTLHIGTVVLCDEAVRNFRDQNLVLKWKFYDQAVTMARMRAGRVVLFDFSTEYDVKVTEHFLNYLKYEQMPISICAVDHEEHPYARCALPLRDALLHINTRADMSLALVADPHMLKARETKVEEDTLDTGDELGVIDLWCLLRADAHMVPGIKLAIAQPGAGPMSREHHSPSLSHALDDYNEFDLTLLRSEPTATQETTGKNQSYDNVEYTRTSNTWRNLPRPRQATETETAQTDSTYDLSKYPPLRERNWDASPSALPTSHDKPQDRRQSEMIISEVNPKIKAPGDMKHALEGSNRLNDSKLPKSEDDLVSGAQSSHGSLQTHSGERRSFIKKLRKASRSGGRLLKITDRDAASDMEIFKKYDNISKAIGSNRTDQSKRVTIVPELVDSQFEVPQRDVFKEPKTIANRQNIPKLEITILWLALNDECDAMVDPHIQRLYVAYSFLGRSGAELETPVSLPKPKHYVDKCYFNFKKVFELDDKDLVKLGHMARCRSDSATDTDNEKDCIIFSVVSEPAEDPLGIESCQDIGYAALYLGDLLAYSAGSPAYSEVVPVRTARAPDVCGVLAVRVHGLDVVRHSLLLTTPEITPRTT